ncbi:MAG: tagatose-6-phosphate ketose isomerase [Streptococcus pyogenes]|nr:MAG: tagatose-6-phosphate ketose isomerase [Streptococcus pyogenes]
MFTLAKPALEKLGAEITTREIKQQPELWQECFEAYLTHKEEVTSFLNQVIKSADSEKVKVIFTGAGTSEYVGNTIWAYLQQHGDRKHFIFQSIASTDLVSAPAQFLYPEETVLLVSFARSGNSPESVGAVNLVNQLIPNAYHLQITCAKEGQLAKQAIASPKRQYLMLMPERSNDAGFAMTGSFTSMLLSALLIFDQSLPDSQKKTYVTAAVKMAQDIIAREDQLQTYVDLDFNRMVYLGSGSLAGLTREAQLKVLELTAGKVATVYDSTMGFRHGPKSFINPNCLVIDFVNNDPYTRQYDLDLLEEVKADGITSKVIAFAQDGGHQFSGETFKLLSEVKLPDVYLALPMILAAQTLALLIAVKIGNTPDTPSASGTVNRVVKGVTLHPYPTN